MPGSLLEQQWDEGADPPDQPEHVDLQYPLPVDHRHALGRAQHGDAGVVAQDVDPAKASHGLVAEPVDVIIGRDVASDGDGIAPHAS